MATKTPTRPRQRQSSQKRSWYNLTDRRKLRHIENTLDKAIAEARSHAAVESHEDFKAYVESYSERSGKAPITVELCEGGGSDDEIRGYRFYLTSDPSQRTSGKYLIKNLEGVTDKDENYFTPSNIADIFGFAEAEFDDLDAGLDDTLDLDDDFDEEPDEELETLLEADLDTDLDLEESVVPAAAENCVRRQTKTQSKATSKAQTQGKSSKSNGRDFRYRDPLEEASRFSASAAVNGRENNGINVAGLAGQLATLGILVGQGVLENLAAQDEEERIARIVRELQRQNEQVDQLTDRLREATTERSGGVLQEEPTHSATQNPLATAAATVGNKVDALGVKLDPNYKSQPLELDREASISEQLDQIEAYLKGLAKRLDRLEIAVSRLEERLAEQTIAPTTAAEVDAEESQVSEAQPTRAESGVLEQLIAHRANPQQAACAESLVGFARAARAMVEEAGSEAIAISSNKTLQMEEQDNQLSIALTRTQGNPLFAGTRTGGEWAIAHDHLSPDEKASISRLPQSKEDYITKASAQALVTALQEKLPERFSGEAEPVFAWTDQGKAKYEFEVVNLPNGTQLLQGFNPNHQDELVFDALLVTGQAPDILHCSISVEEMEAVMGESVPERSPAQPATQSSNRSADRRREELQA